MTSASLELQGAVIARLKSWQPLQDIVGAKIYDRVPAETAAPYVEIGDFDDHRDDKTCVRSRRIYVTIHAWSDYSASRVEASRIATAVENALHEAPLSLPTHRLISMDHLRSQVFQDLDGIHFHGVVEFIAWTEEI